MKKFIFAVALSLACSTGEKEEFDEVTTTEEKQELESTVIKNEAMKIIVHYESLHDGDSSKIGLQPKLCPTGYWTIGYGHVIVENGKLLSYKNATYEYVAKKYTIKDEAEAIAILQKDVDSIYTEIEKSLEVDITKNQMVVCIDFAYNLGVGRLFSSTMFKMMVAKKDFFQEIRRWRFGIVKGVTTELPGLICRCESRRSYAEKGKIIFYEYKNKKAVPIGLA